MPTLSTSIRPVSYRTTAALACLVAFAAAPHLRADTSDVDRITIARVARFLQLSPGDPFLEPAPFGFIANAEATAPGRIVSGAFALSSGQPISLAIADNQVFTFSASFATFDQLNAAFPDGTYSFRLSTVTPPTDFFASIDATVRFPNTTPKLLNSEWRSVVIQFDTRQDFTFRWNQFADFVFDPPHLSGEQFEIADIFNNLIVAGGTDSPVTSVTEPAGTLSPGLYVGRVYFINIDRGQIGSTSLFNFSARVTEFVISAVNGAPIITSDTNITVNAGQLFIYGIDATNLPSEFNAANLPPGVNVDTSLGLIGGYPTTGGTYQVPISATNVVGTGSATLTVNVQQSSLAITSSTRAAGRVNTPFRFQVLAPGATSAARLSASNLPAGLQVNAVTGEIFGTATVADDFAVQLHITDGSASADGVLLISLSDDPAFPSIKGATTANLTPGQNFVYQIDAMPISTAAGSGLGGTNAADQPSYSFIGQLPAGLNFDPKNGVISGAFQGHPQRDTDARPTRLSGGALVGNIQLVASNSRGTSTVPLVFFNSPVGAVNISTRLAIAGGDNVLIGGFIVTGNAPKKLIVRALGPSLPVPGALADPVLEIHGSDGSLLLGNDSWRSDDAQSIIDTGIAPADDREAAIVAAFQPNVNYTAIVKGKDGSSGVALVELYDLGTAALDSSSTAKLANISTRGLVQTGDNVMIGGFIISQVQSKVIARAIGPSLTKAGVTGALQDTVLELHGADGQLVASNDDWQTDQAQQINDTGVPPADARESAVLATLNPGSYTAVVRGKNNATGVALVEVYALQ